MARKRTHDEYVNELKIKNPSFEVLEQYINARTKILHRSSICGHEWKVVPETILSEKSCPLCNNISKSNKLKKTHEQFIRELGVINKNISVLSEYVKSDIPIEVMCLKCSGIWKSSPHNLLAGRGCIYCGTISKKVLIGLNDLETTCPELSKFLLNAEDKYKYTKGSHKKVDWKCSSCGTVIKNKAIYSIVASGKILCSQCSDGISYPNKIMFNILTQLNIDFEVEKTFKWGRINQLKEKSKVRYDFFFKNNDKKYIIEMDGGWHNKDNNMSGQTAEESIKIDQLKDKIAEKHGIHMIRIDCGKSELTFIRNNIFNSELRNIIPLSKIDWIKCHNDIIKSNKSKVAEMWNNGFSVVEISVAIKRERNTIAKWLKDCACVGLCNYTRKESIIRGQNNASKSSLKKSVLCIETNCIYESITEARKSLKNGGGSHIGSCCQNKRNTAGGYHWKYAS